MKRNPVANSRITLRCSDDDPRRGNRIPPCQGPFTEGVEIAFQAVAVGEGAPEQLPGLGQKRRQQQRDRPHQFEEAGDVGATALRILLATLPRLSRIEDPVSLSRQADHGTDSLSDTTGFEGGSPAVASAGDDF